MDAQHENQLPSASIEEGFEYEIRIDKDADLFKVEPFSSDIPNFGEMIIQSEWFDDHAACKDDCSQLLLSLSMATRAVSDKKLVLATKINPMHSPDFDGDLRGETWEASWVMKIFVADRVALKEQNLIVSSITGLIRTAPRVFTQEHSDLLQ